MTNTNTKNSGNKMELNRTSVSIISSLLTAAVLLGGFCYRTGVNNEKLNNLNTKIIKIEEDYILKLKEVKKDCSEKLLEVKKDIKEDIKHLDKMKAEQSIVDLIFETMKDMNKKIDTLIQYQSKE